MTRRGKTQRVLASDAPAAPALQRHLPVVRAPLLAFLTARDVVVLLATSRTLRDDRETVRFAMETMKTTRCFFRGCLMDWCAATPTFTHLGDIGCSGDHETSSDTEDDGDDESTDECDTQHGQSDGVANEEEAEEDMAAVRASPARCASLLSLAALMDTKLSAVIYTEDQAYVTDYYVVPLILPLGRLRAIAREHPPPGAPTPLGLHIENCETSDDDVVCGLCKAIVSAIEHAAAYREEREAQEAALTQKLLRDGVLEGSDAFQQAMDATRESKQETDELYSEDRYDRYNVNDTLAALCEGGQLGDLELCGGVEYDMALEACHDDYYNSQRFCETKLRPLVAFFARHGFGRVHRAKVRDYATVDGELHRDDVRSVEMVGVAAPHGFFAGVYFMARYT